MYAHRDLNAACPPQAHAERSKRPSKPALLAGAAVLALAATLCPAAGGQHKITGRVLDDADRPVFKAIVIAKDEKTGAQVAPPTETADDGTFSLTVASPGIYAVETTSMKPSTAASIVTVKDGAPPPLNVRLVNWRRVLIPYLVNVICGALILILLDVWLRGRGVKDPSLIWLYLTLLSWAMAVGVQLINFKFLQTRFEIGPEEFKYLFSIISSVLFTMTAFRLSRFRELFRGPQSRRWPARAVWFVFGLSMAAWVLLVFFKEHRETARFMDAGASMAAAVILCASLTYSFHRYGNQPLVWLTALVFLIFIGRQFFIAFRGTPASGMPAAIFLADSTLLIMVFIALAVAWGLSDTSRLRPVGGAPNVQVAALFFDLRGSTTWASEMVERDRNYVRNFLDELREWALGKAEVSRMGRPNMVKFLGDGFMWVWEVEGDNMPDSADRAADLGCRLRTEYLAWVKGKDFRRKFPWGAPTGIGVGVDIGPAIRLTFENGSDDYLGEPVNVAAKMQGLARPHGVAITAKIYNVLEDLASAFPKEASMKMGDREIPMRLTEDVAL